jgi:hypothetical protein
MLPEEPDFLRFLLPFLLLSYSVGLLLALQGLLVQLLELLVQL